MTTVGLADDQQLVRAGFAMVLDSQDDITVVWEAATGREACERAAEQPVDIILMDVQMPEMDGVRATELILAEPPRPGVLVLTVFDLDEYVYSALRAGASGFLLKDADPEELIAAVRTVGESAAVISPTATARLLRSIRDKQSVDVPLTPREREILVLMALGHTNQEIADELFISLPTVKTHVGRVLMKTDSRDRVHAVLYAFRNGLVSADQLLEG